MRMPSHVNVLGKHRAKATGLFDWASLSSPISSTPLSIDVHVPSNEG